MSQENSCDGYASELLQALFRSGRYNDVTIRIISPDSPGSDKSWKVHKCVLATASQYFEVMFSGDFKESHENEIVLNDFPDHPTLDLVLNSVYGGGLNLDESNVLNVLKISNLLQFTRIENKCWEYIVEDMDDINSLDVLTLADQLGHKPAYDKAIGRVTYNFKHIRLTPEYLELDVDLVLKLLSSDDLRLVEMDVVSSLLEWINYDRLERMDYLPRLIRTVRVPLLTREFLDDQFADLELDEATRDYIERGLSPTEPPPHPRKTIFNTIAAVSFIQDRLLVHVYCPAYKAWIKDVIKCNIDCPHSSSFIVDHSLFSFSTMIKKYSFVTDSWENFTWFRNARHDFACATLANELYIIGGRKHRIEKQVQKLNLLTKEWSTLAELNEGREHATAVAFKDRVYVIGGRSPGEILSTVEFYSPSENTWTPCSDMLIPRMMSEVALCDDKFYVFGGFQGIDIRLFVTQIEVYDPVTDTWSICGQIGDENVTFSLSATTFANEIYYLLNNETHCQFGKFDPAQGQTLDVISDIEKRPGVEIELAYSSIHGIRSFVDK